MTKTINFTVNAINFDQEGYKAYRAAEQAAEISRAQLIASFRKSDRFRAAYDLAKTSDYRGMKIEPVVSLQGGLFNVSIYLDERDTTATTQVNMDTKLVNALLHGKLLTDKEKRGLIKAIAPGVLLETEGGAA